jgi:hypothetical protein
MKAIARGPSLAADAGQIVDVPESLGRELVAGHFAEVVDTAPSAPVPEVLLAKTEIGVETALASPAAVEIAAEKRGPRAKGAPKA